MNRARVLIAAVALTGAAVIGSHLTPSHDIPKAAQTAATGVYLPAYPEISRTFAEDLSRAGFDDTMTPVPRTLAITLCRTDKDCALASGNPIYPNGG